MEAKDTVMSPKDILTAIGKKDYERFTITEVAKAQAEISFKAGKEEEYTKWIKACMKASMLISKPEQLTNLYKVGIREVVEWSDDICILHGDADARVRQGKVLRQGNCYECWQAQKKKWGIKIKDDSSSEERLQ